MLWSILSEQIRCWADNYTHNGSMYVATGSAVCTSNAYVSIVENILTLEKEDNLN